MWAVFNVRFPWDPGAALPGSQMQEQRTGSERGIWGQIRSQGHRSEAGMTLSWGCYFCLAPLSGLFQ